MHKVSYRPNEYFRYLGVDEAFRQRRQGKRVTIGHDVWIGHGAVVMPGAVDRQRRGRRRQCGGDARCRAPTRSSPAVPARVLRPRFPAEIAARIETLAWWDWPQERLFEAVPDMQALPIEAFLDRWGA